MYRARTDSWYLERIVFVIAGVVVLGGTILGIVHHPYWFALPILAGLNMLIFAFTGFCPAAIVLYKLGARPMCGRPEA
ncbi:DUF2892 domain-containing protein [Dissulfurirhabdus thermomarina]|uniref:DUF2892 domain-containing protein n=1 Tax=Dissulfurirhabdus thermomarina TaxID=1765737 RepID=A0A6N9TQW8_DISTH|nr:DUF2892 domain-containing protein [Dissulfurirhabdus thermomarina]NDY42503.1 DUF2892 domain-containing protein [Dissulfurirhabdus thermomarina]NMX24191.1 DUF2892 domain-containing protein [Dissulfurirhabdus thermomarina]